MEDLGLSSVTSLRLCFSKVPIFENQRPAMRTREHYLIYPSWSGSPIKHKHNAIGNQNQNTVNYGEY